MKILILDKQKSFREALYINLKFATYTMGLDVGIRAPYDFNYNNIEQWANYIDKYQPDVLIFRGGVTTINYAQKNIDLTYDYNVLSTKKIVDACKKHNVTCIFLSTPFVFSQNMVHYEDAICNPINVYGNSMYQAEQIVESYDKSYIIRTGELFGYQEDFINGFIKKSQEFNLVKANETSKINVTYIANLVRDIYYLLLNDNFNYGIYHMFSDGTPTEKEICEYVFDLCQIRKAVVGTTYTDSKEILYYPENVLLGTKYDTVAISREWTDDLNQYIFQLLKDNSVLSLKNNK